MTNFYLNENLQCKNCTHETLDFFKYVESRYEEQLNIDNSASYVIVLMLTGKASISYNDLPNISLDAGKVCLFPEMVKYKWRTINDASCIVFTPSKLSRNICDLELIQHYADYYPAAPSTMHLLNINSVLMAFSYSLKKYLNDGINCPNFYYAKREELAMILRSYYSPREMVKFFMPLIKKTDRFELLILNNYLKMRGVKEFVDLSGLNISTFNRKFKAKFGESPYQWMIKMRSKHILQELHDNDKSIADIMRQFNFTDASHFNRYCKTIFGTSPSQLRLDIKNKLLNTLAKSIENSSEG